jgi:hypothetical protein
VLENSVGGVETREGCDEDEILGDNCASEGATSSDGCCVAAEVVTCATRTSTIKLLKSIVCLTAQTLITVCTIIRYRRPSVRRTHQGNVAARIRT